MKKELIELGSLVDLIEEKWDVFCESKTFKGRGEDLEVVVENITLEYASGGFISTLKCASLADMPDCFSQKQVNALEEKILEDKRIDMQSYYQDLHSDSQRGER